jgi:enoyl-CoA hydratase
MSLVKFENRNGNLWVALNRREALNAINRPLLEELLQGLEKSEGDGTIRSLILLGEGGCFASGADIRELSSLDAEGVRNFHALREKTFARLEDFPSPTIALIEKFALGTGLELALCCDFRVASSDAQLGVPSAKLGLVESYEYFARLLRAVGPSWAKRMVFTGEPVDAATALRIGLVEEVCPGDQLFQQIESILGRMEKNSAAAIRETKRVISECRRDPNLDQVADSAAPMVSSTQTQDFREATKAFLERKRRQERI